MEIIESREIIGYETPDLYIIFRINNGVRRKVGSAKNKSEASDAVRLLFDYFCGARYAYELNPKYNN